MSLPCRRVLLATVLSAALLAVGAAPAMADEGHGSEPADSVDHSNHAKPSKRTEDTSAKIKKAKDEKANNKQAKDKQKSKGPGSAGRMGVDDGGLSLLSNGHHDEMVREQPLTREERRLLAHQVEATIATAKRYATVADALAAGYQQTGPYLPGIGAHFIRVSGQALNPDGVMDDGDLAEPLAIIYDGTSPGSEVAGFMFYSMREDEPEGFAGKNDVWHYHEDICLKYTTTGIELPYGLDRSATKQQCAALGGTLMRQTQWMVHVWSVPGWESRQGLFGEVNPALMCPDGSYLQYRPSQWSKHPDNACKSAA